MNLKLKIFSVIIAFILIVGLVFIFSDLKKPEEEIEISPGQLYSEQTTLFWSEVDFNEIHLNNEDENNELVFLKNDQGNWEIAESFGEKINLNKLDQAVSIIFSLSGHSKEVELTTDDVFTGEEERSITLMNQSGMQAKLTIGNKNEDETHYYVKLLDSDEIYQVAVQLIDALPSSQEDLIDRSIIQTTSQQVSKITIDNSLQMIELAPISPFSEEEVRENLSGWYMHEPYRNVYSVKYNPMAEMIYGIKNIEWLEVVDESVEDIGKYGLEDPNLKLTFSSKDNEETILIGAPATSETVYAKIVDDDKVFTVANSALHPYRFQAFDLVERFVKPISIDVLKQLEILTENESFILTIDQNESNIHANSDLVFYINNQQIDDEPFRELYETITDLSVDAEIDDAIYRTPEIIMVYTILDSIIGEREVVVELVNYDEENYAVFLENQADFLINKADIFQMIEDISDHLE